MKAFSIAFLTLNIVLAQEAVNNYGDFQIHATSEVGFHIDLINNGSLDQNSGLVGFYGYDKSLTVSGAFTPIFYDTEIVVDYDFFLQTSIEVKNNINYITGNVVTPREFPDISLIFQENAFYVGSVSSSKTDGYVTIYNKNNFIFPIGDNDRLRALELNSEEVNPLSKSAYFYENPNAPISFDEVFDTQKKAELLTEISTYEYWVLECNTSSKIKLTWDMQSQLSQFVDEPENVRIVGWHATDKIWRDIGNTDFSGDLNEGNVTSDTFIPSEYSAITFGTIVNMTNIALDSYLMTPNNDGINDFFNLDAIQSSPNNHLDIYNRWGRLVYSKDDYRNTFDGTTNVNATIAKDNKLPDGVYFYVINLFDLDILHQGYLYLNK